VFLISCGKNDDQKKEDAILNAKYYLTSKNCQKAIDALEAVGRDSKHAKYVQTLASAYACRTGYSTPVFYGTNLPKLSATSTAFFGSLTKFSTSSMTSPTDSSYVDLQTAIDILLYAGSISSPSSAGRLNVFSTAELQDINIQNLFMILTQLGKFMFYYGNADPTNGKKGTGSTSNGNTNNFSNGCFYNYDPSNATLLASMNAVRAAGTIGTCTTTATGHEKLLALPSVNTVKRMCQGIVLFNNMLDILSNTTLPVNGLDLNSVLSSFQSTCTSISGAGDICTVKSQAACELDFAVSPQTDKLQLYFFNIFEALFQ
jgi:hypothetical protein